MQRASHHFASTLILTALVAACTDPLTEPRGEVARAFTILDAARGGSAGFYFLPPMAPAPGYSGTFDAAQSPVVVICELTGNVCGATVASFSGSEVKVDLAEEAYKVSWKTKDAGLDPAKLYRIEVRVGTSVLGFADVMVLNSGNQIRTVDRNQFVATINGGVLTIRFRIETAAPPPPPPPPPGNWQHGDLLTFWQETWNALFIARSTILFDNWLQVYASTFGTLTIGTPGTPGYYSMGFSSPSAVISFLPASGAPAVLSVSLFNPVTSPSGVFGGEVLALALNVDFADARAEGGVLSASGPYISAGREGFGTSVATLGDLMLCNLPGFAFEGFTIRQFLSAMNTVLGGEAGGYDIGELWLVTADLNAAFADGQPSSFAQQHIAYADCQPVSWQDGQMFTLTQEGWVARIAGPLHTVDYLTVYASTFGTVEIGLPGASGFSLRFSSPSGILAYLPSSGVPGPLSADLFNPVLTPSGVFGGQALALRLNIDFSDAGYLAGTSALKFGDLTLCNVAPVPSGTTVREFMDIVNTALGGGSTPYSFNDLTALTRDLNGAFESGRPSQFAQDHLVNGACP